MFIVYGVLCGLLGALVGAVVGMFAGLIIAHLTRMSSFEGKSGFFMAFTMVIGGAIGFLATAIGMSIYFHSKTG
jgi:hypothetical protein